MLPYPVAGLSLTADQALSLSAVWACIDAIAKAVASCRWNIYQPNGPGRRTLLDDDPVAWLLNTRPNPEMTAIGFREALLFTALPFGNAYAEIVRDNGGRVSALYPMPEDRVTPSRVPGTWELVYEYRQPDGTTEVLTQRQVFHLRGPGLYGLMGDNIIARAAKSLAVAAAQERHAASYFGQGANPGGVLELAGTLSEQAYTRLKEDWAEKKKGPENAHKPMILEAGMKWTTIGSDPQKSQLVEGRQFSVEEVCRWFGVPPHKVQHLLHATFSNIEHSSLEFVRDALTPWCRRLEQEADYKLFPQNRGPWRHTGIDTAPLSYGDALSRAQAHAVWRQNGIMSANEIREREGMNDAGDDGDVLLVQSNLTTVDRLMNPPAPPAPPTAPPAELDPSTEEDDGDDAEGVAIARDAVRVIMTAALERHQRRLANHRANLERRGVAAQDIDLELLNERSRLLPRLLAELAPAAPFAARALGRSLSNAELSEAATLVAAGHPPAAVVEKALPASCPRAG